MTRKRLRRLSIEFGAIRTKLTSLGTTARIAGVRGPIHNGLQ